MNSNTKHENTIRDSFELNTSDHRMLTGDLITDVHIIHYINHLFHLTQLFKDKVGVDYLKSLKYELQNEFIFKHHTSTKIIIKPDPKFEGIYSIQIPEYKLDIAHIPEEQLIDEIKQILGLKGAVK